MLSGLRRRAEILAGFSGAKRNAVAFAFGVSATLTLPPIYVFPLIIPAYGGLFYLTSRAPSVKRAFYDGWFWGMGFFTTGLYWFCIALLTDPEKFAWLIPFCLLGLNAIIAIYPAIACMFFRALKLRGLTAGFVFSVVWVLVEFARGHLLSGFPWNLAGYAFTASDSLLQSASLLGAYGLTWFTVLLGVVPLFLCDVSLSIKRSSLALAVSYGLLIACIVWGHCRLVEADKASETEQYVPGVTLRLVQANIEQSDKWDPQRMARGVQEYARLTQSPGIEAVTHVIWPETAVPYPLEDGSTLPKRLGDIIPPKTTLVAGMIRAKVNGQSWDIWNSMVAISHNGTVLNEYDKTKLVPFGEYLPFRSVLPDSITTPVGMKDLSAGVGAHVLEFSGLRVAPIICYEAIFPEFIAQGEQPMLLLNITNDAWFGRSLGPYQHFQMARMRAVEQMLPLVRVANTGISAITDRFGRIKTYMGLGQKGFADGRLPVATSSRALVAIYGIFYLPLLTLLATLLTLYQRKSKK